MGKQGIVSEAVRRVQERLAIGPPRRIAPGTPTPRIAIIGSGFGGIGMGMPAAPGRHRRRSRSTRRPTRVGGTWRDNTYPGAACDVPSHLYSFSFAAKVRLDPEVPRAARDPRLPRRAASTASASRAHLRFGTELAEATFDEDAGHLAPHASPTAPRSRPTCWSPPPASSTGRTSPTSTASTTSSGHEFHSARWDHDHDLTGRDVAVIGIGASAIQFVPEIAKQARSLTLFQRSSNYVGPKPDGPILRSGPGAHAPRSRWPSGSTALSIWVRFDARFAMLQSGLPRRPACSRSASRRASRRW